MKEHKGLSLGDENYLQNLIIDIISSFNQCIAFDQVTGIYQFLRAIMATVPYIYKPRNRVDNYYLLTQRWNAKLLVYISGKESKTMLKHILSILSSFFNYPEIEDEMKMCLRHYQRNHNSVKEELKSDHACTYIEEVIIPIENNIEYLCRYKFIDVTTFGFVGDIIVKASNSGLKMGDVTVSTNINVDKSALTQIQIGKT